MSRPSKLNTFSDVTEQAQTTLDYIIAGEGEKKVPPREERIPVSEALQSKQVVSFGSSRVRSRILFITSDPEALKESSWVQQHLQDISSAFAEVHVAVLTSGKKREYPTQRLDKNIWIYKVNFTWTWFLPLTMERFANGQLLFGGGFRPDVIVALDPFYSGIAAEALASRFERPFQIHVLEDFLSPGFASVKKENKQKVSIARKVLKKAKSVRTNSSLLKDKLHTSFPKIEDLGMLPRHFDTDAMLRNKRTNFLKQKYPQYVFMILTTGVLGHDNTVYRVLDAARSMLFSPRIGLMVVGDGPMRASLEKRAEILGIKEQVVFEKSTTNLYEYMLSADMYVCSDTTAAGDDNVIQAAAAGLPMVIARTPLRDDLFVDGESAFLCAAEDTVSFTQKMNSILNTNAYRIQFGANARIVIKDRLHTDPELYKAAYRDTIEVVFGNADLPERRSATEGEESGGEVNEVVQIEPKAA